MDGATGPTAALTQYVAGVAPELSSAVQFHFIPHLGNLSRVAATVPLAQGTVSVSSCTHSSGNFAAQVNAPSSMTGRYGVPIESDKASVALDGTTVWSSCATVSAAGVGTILSEGNYVYLSQVTGSHTITARNTCDQ